MHGKNSDDLLVGRQLGGYTILRRLGHGGMADVYVAHQVSMNRDVAVKVMRRDLIDDYETFYARFVREARTIAALEHVHILPVIDFGEAGGVTYLVMRLLAGNLKDHLKAEAPLPLNEVTRLLGQISEALDYAHAKQVIHRDLKPANVLMDDQLNCFLADFGIARLMTEQSIALTAEGAMVGTPGYMAPEQIEGQPATAASDIYALGVILYEMLYGRLPFIGETPFAVMHQHLNAPPELPLDKRPDLPRDAREVLFKALSKAPEARYASAGAMADAFIKAAHGASDTYLDHLGAAVVETPTELGTFEPPESTVGQMASQEARAPALSTERPAETVFDPDPAAQVTPRITVPAPPAPDQTRRTVWLAAVAAVAVGLVVLLVLGQRERAQPYIEAGLTALEQSNLSAAAHSFGTARALDSALASAEPVGTALRDLSKRLNDAALDALMSLDYDAAIEQFKTAIGIDPGYASAHFNLGVAYEELGQLDEARTAYEDALEQNDQLLPARYRLAELLLDMGEEEEAFVIADRGLEMLIRGTVEIEAKFRDQFLFFLYTTRGRAYSMRGGENALRLAEQDLQSALILKDAVQYPAAAYYYLAQVYEAMDKTEAAREAWENVQIYHDRSSGRQREWAAEAEAALAGSD